MKHQLSSEYIIMAEYGSQGHIIPQTTAHIDGIDHYGYPSRLVLDLNDDNHAISSLYRSDEIK
jgi:hypothetical protein